MGLVPVDGCVEDVAESRDIAGLGAVGGGDVDGGVAILVGGLLP